MNKTFILILFILINCPSYLLSKTERALKAQKELENIKAKTAPEEVERIFDEFCNTHFIPSTESLYHEKWGKDIKFIRKSNFTLRSSRSIFISFQSNLPSKSFVNYGQSLPLKSKLENSKRLYFNHSFYLKDLEPDTLYFLQYGLIDEQGNQKKDAIIKFKTLPDKGFENISGGTFKEPIVLDKPDTKYVLTGDVTAEKTAFIIKARGISLDLGGHTVTYHNKDLDQEKYLTDKWMSYVHNGSFGIKNIGFSNFSLKNGTIKEGKGWNRGNNDTTGFNPVYLRKVKGVRITGVTVDYYTPQNAGIHTRHAMGVYEIKHCVFNDRGTMMQNRHGNGCSSLDFIAPQTNDIVVHHNLVKRSRQNGLRAGTLLYDNEIYIDSWATNSFATGVRKEKGVSRDNKIFCTGYHAIACPWGNGIKVTNNFIYMQGINTGRTRWWEGFGDQNSMNGLRHTQWGNNKKVSENSEYSDNIVIVKTSNGGMARGVEFFSDTFIKNLVLKNSIIKVEAHDDKTLKASCVVTHGLAKRKDKQNPVYYKNCRFISNYNHVKFGDKYGVGSNHIFSNCSFEKIGKHDGYHTLSAGGAFWSLNHQFIDCKVTNGASFTDVNWGKTKEKTRDYSILWTCLIKAPKDSHVSIFDKKNIEVFKGITGPSKKISVALKEFTKSLAGEDVYGPYKVKIKTDKTNKTYELSPSFGLVLDALK